jgi:prevent-host-death family protein
MKAKVGIAELKAHLSEYVRAAQNGKETIIKDRQTPVAKLVPIEQPQQMIGNIRRATRTVAEAEAMLAADPSGPLVSPETFQRILDEVRADRSDEWIFTRT